MSTSHGFLRSRSKSVLNVVFGTIGFVSSIITIATLFTASSLTALFAWFVNEKTLIIPLFTFALGVGISLMIFVIFNLRANRKNKPGTITQVTDRTGYVETVIEHIKESHRAVFLCVNTLDSSKKAEKIKLLQDSLQEAKATGKDVKIIAPVGIERVEAGYELFKIKHVPIKFLSYLGDEDFRFTIIDEDVSIVPIGVRDKPSNGCIVIISERLNGLLKTYSNELWERPEAIDYDGLVAYAIHELRDPKHPLTNTKLAERMGIPQSEVERILPNVLKI